MRVHELVSKNRKLRNLDLPVSSLYELAKPGTPPEAIEAVAARAEAGEKLTGAEVKDIVLEAKLAKMKKTPGNAKYGPGNARIGLEEMKAIASVTDFFTTSPKKSLKEQKAEARKLITKLGLKEAVAILVEEYGIGPVTDAVLDHK